MTTSIILSSNNQELNLIKSLINRLGEYKVSGFKKDKQRHAELTVRIEALISKVTLRNETDAKELSQLKDSFAYWS